MKHRSYVGPEDKYDLVSAMQFNILTSLGLRETHKVLDIGCGSLRLGRLLIPYLSHNCYFGIEPNKGLVEDGLNYESGFNIANKRSARFSNNSDFDLTVFDQKFDYIVAHSIFSHAGLDQINTCLASIRKVLKGTAIVTFCHRKQDHTEGWTYPGVIGYRQETINKLFADNGLKGDRKDWEHPNKQIWYGLCTN